MVDLYELTAIMVEAMPPDQRIPVPVAYSKWWYRRPTANPNLRLSSRGFVALTQVLEQKAYHFPCPGMRLGHILALSRIIKSPYYISNKEGPSVYLFGEEESTLAVMYGGIIPYTEALSTKE